MIIAIDGPAGSGKSSTAREVARRLGFLHIDSGAFYRALTYALLSDGVPEDAWEGLRPEDLDRFRIAGERDGGRLTIRVGSEAVADELRTPDVNARVSHVARIPAVRTWLLGRLHDLASATDVVIDGRDIGTAVFPDAGLKIFLEADPEVRARRRLAEQGVSDPDDEALLEEVGRLRARDRLDSEREVAPLRKAGDAVRVDTTALTFDEQIEAILELARARA
ncbi:MAG: (d)CMP kinase [Gemmatimonadetes bacterium]|nr:(d)CMP kinase [Gemmatimonadota bacterium]